MIGLALAAALAWQDPPQNAIRPLTPEESAEFVAEIAARGPPETGDWRAVWRDAESGGALDVANVVREGSLRTVWIARAEPSHDGPAGAYGLMKIDFDCDRALARPRWFAIHAASGANLVGFAPEEDFEPYSAESGGAAIAAVICDDQPLAGPGFPTHQAFAASITGVS